MRQNNTTTEHRHLPAHKILTDVQIKIIKAISKKPLSKSITAGQALLEVARIGGHFKHNGDPGWQVLSRGLQELNLMEIGFRAAREQ
ncbi:MAG: hypothetical protein JRJ87_14165 [Deltaproteobacteria bacterium]|nr:hypothetical protein [Deltaproteobacteria bacterium]